ncbi:hypothetical protein [Sulfuritalea hydrogenivorans]|uniref:Uncharacterized protein n=1 Tax=Sulfuritalea hydrogenivorans sk43H TaxID=1223802 RepID=W0SHL8_9PROT|nr:hypothetical protein [Sulfuritalea hydrogenivorans]BAO29388.1 hypothetical protein [Sulfuritalea hydrogenivorans sk43H]
MNWFLVIVELCRRGFTHSSIATSVGTPKSTVQGWKQGAEPKHCDGERMIALWCQVTGLDRSGLPKISRYDWRA